MILTISWIQFQQHFLKTNDFVYVLEELEKWVLYYAKEGLIVKSVVPKSEEPEQNFMFVDTYLNDSNVIKVESVSEKVPVMLRLVQE